MNRRNPIPEGKKSPRSGKQRAEKTYKNAMFATEALGITAKRIGYLSSITPNSRLLPKYPQDACFILIVTRQSTVKLKAQAHDDGSSASDNARSHVSGLSAATYINVGKK